MFLLPHLHVLIEYWSQELAQREKQENGDGHIEFIHLRSYPFGKDIQLDKFMKYSDLRLIAEVAEEEGELPALCCPISCFEAAPVVQPATGHISIPGRTTDPQKYDFSLQLSVPMRTVKAAS